MSERCIDNFDASKALQYAKELAYPRRVGSEGENRAAEYVGWKFRSFELSTWEESFTLSTACWFWWRIMLGILILSVTMVYFLAARDPEISAVLAILTLMGLSLTGPFRRKMLPRSVEISPSMKGLLNQVFFRPGRLYRSRNVLARLPSPTQSEGKVRLFLVAHYDTKSQSIPLALRMILVGIFALGTVFICLWSVLYKGWPPFAPSGSAQGAFLWGLTVLAGVTLLLLKAGNASDGAVDNASGIGLLLHLAEILAQREAAQDLEVTFVATGAEEFGLCGAFAYCKAHREELIGRERTYVLNLDSLGGRGKLYVVHKAGPLDRKDRLVRTVQEVARRQSVRVRSPLIMLGAMTDHLPFAAEGIEAATLARTFQWAHTSKDRADQLDPRRIEEAGRIILGVIEEMRGGSVGHPMR